jgi:hypothetical protein
MAENNDRIDDPTDQMARLTEMVYQTTININNLGGKVG